MTDAERIEQLEGEVAHMKRVIDASVNSYQDERERNEKLGELLDEALAALDEISLEAVDGSATRKSEICVMAVGAIARIKAERSSHER